MADLNNTIVRGKLRVTEDINANGNITTNGNVTGNGSGLTNLNASNISSGTLSADRLDTSSISAGNGIVLTPSGNSLAISVNSTSSVTSGSTALITSGAVYDAIQSAITTALNTSV